MPYRPSYWERDTFLRPPDVLVVGAGLTGLQAALALKRRAPALDVLVVERAAIPRGASTRNAGFACFGGPTELLADLAAYGETATLATVRDRYAGIRALEENYAGRGIDWAAPGGYELVDDPETSARVREQLPRLNELLAEVTGLATTWGPVPEAPHFPPGTLLLRNPLEAQLHPGKLVRLLRADAGAAGVRFLWGCPVTEVRSDATGASVGLAGHGTLRARQVLLTVNAFARQLLPADFPEVIRPVRNQVLLSRPLPGLRLRGCYHYHEGYVYFRNVGPDRLLIGGARHRAGRAAETAEFGSNPVPETYLLDKLRAWFPGRPWTPALFPERWSGILAQGDGKTPVLRFAGDHLLVAARLAGMGVALSADLAERAAARLLGAIGPGGD